MDYSEILWIEPVENGAEMPMGVRTSKDAPKDMKGFRDIFPVHLGFITTVQNSLKNPVKLANILLKNESVIIV